MRKLAIDLGTKKCGFAISDPFNMFATPLENYIVKNNDYSDVINQIKMYLNEYEIDLILIGYPLRLTDTRSQMTQNVEQFYLQLKKTVNVKIEFIDERLSTKKAMSTLKQSLSTSKAKHYKDAAAAVIILNEYLNNF